MLISNIYRIKNSINIFNTIFLFCFLVLALFIGIEKTKAASCVLESGSPLMCGGSSREASGNSGVFVSTGPGIVVQKEFCDYQYTIGTDYYKCDGVVVSTQPSSGAVCTKTLISGSCSYQTVSGCATNADCPHPPGIVCDTYCDLSGGSPGSCRPVDPACSTASFAGGYCGDSYCSSGETNANCASDCPVTPTPDIQIIVTPSSRTITRGGSTSYTLTAVMLGGFYNKVTLSAVCPPGASCTITPNQTSYDSDGDPQPNVVDPTRFGYETARLDVNNTSGLAVGNYSISVTGVGFGGGPTTTVFPILHVIPGPPSSFTANSTGICPYRTISLTWAPGQDANGYRIYRNTSNSQPATPFVVVGNITSFTDTPPPGFTYYYWIDSINNPSGNSSAVVASNSVALYACPTVSMLGWGDSVPQSSPVEGPITVAANTAGGLVWTSTNATNCEIWRGSTSVGSGFGTNSSAPLGGVTASDTHTIVCYGPGGASPADSFTRNVVGAPIADLRINNSTNPPTISYGSTATVSWSSTNATSCSFTAGTGSGSWTGTSGSQTTPTLTATSTTYTLVCSGVSGSDTKSVTVRIPPAPTNPTGSCPAPGTSGSISWVLPSGYTQALVRAYDTAQAWSCGVNQLCTGGYTGSSVALDGSTWPAMVAGHSYGWWVHTYDSVSGAYSNSVGGSFSCTHPIPTVNLKGWGDSVPQSAPVEGPITAAANTSGGLVWTSTNATNCQIWRGSTDLGSSWPANGSAPLGGVTASDTHSIVCYGPGGSSLQDSFTRNIIGAPVADLKINNSTNPPTISYGSTATVTWSTTNATACSFSAGTGSGSWTGTSGSQTTPALTADNTTYTIVCTGPSGSDTKSVTVRIPPAPTNPTGSCPAPGTSATISWTLPSGYTQALVRAYDTAQAWSCGVNQLCTGGYTGTSYSLNGSTWPAMVAGHSYGWWVHTYDSVSGANSNSVGGSFTCTVPSQAAFTIAPTTMSFNSSANVAPAQQILTTTNSGNATLNYTVTTNQSWCRVNGVNNSGSVNGSIPAGGNQNVAISVDGLASIGTYNCTVTFSDPAAAAPTSRTLAVTYTVSSNPLQAICDGAWHAVPNLGSLSQPVGAWVPDSPNIQKKNANIVIVRGADNGIYYQFCNNALGDPCIWDATYTSLGGTTTFPANTEVPTFWNVYHYGTDNNTYLKYNSSSGWQGSWTNQGSTSRSWGQPFRWLDAPTNRTWQVRKNSDTSVSYYCSAPGGGGVCQPLNYVSSRSSLSTSSVTAGGSFTARCDYDSSGIDAVQATVTGGGSCTFSSFDKTTAVFNCTAGSTVGSQSVSCNLASGTSSNVCSQSNTLGNINVTAPSQASFTLNPTTMSFAGTVGSSAPAGQVLQIVSNGTADVWYTATSNQSWCKINGSTSQPGAVASNPPGQNTPVMITVDSPSTVGAGTHTCVVSVVDPSASPTTRTLTVTYTVSNPVGGAGPATVSLDNSTCGQMTINWSAVFSATSYNVYRNTTGSAPVAGDLIQSGITSLTYTNTVGAGSYYYWVSAIVGGTETTKVAPNSGVNTNPTAVTACGQANLNTSDKDFIGINGTSYASNNCGGTDPLANGVSLKLNDRITFQINLCNDSGTGDATNVVVTDTLTNLKMPTGYSNFNAVYNGVALTYDGAVGGSSCTPNGNNHYCAYGTVPNQTLVFNLTSSGNKVPAGLRRNLTFDAQLAVPTGYAQPSARFQNSFIINYNKGATPAVTPISSTPLILFSTGVGIPTIKEIP